LFDFSAGFHIFKLLATLSASYCSVSHSPATQFCNQFMTRVRVHGGLVISVLDCQSRGFNPARAEIWLEISSSSVRLDIAVFIFLSTRDAILIMSSNNSWKIHRI